MVCKICNGTGKVEVSYASAENGPTDDPADEMGIEPCSCDVGHQVWLKEAEESEQASLEFFQALNSRKGYRTLAQHRMVMSADRAWA